MSTNWLGRPLLNQGDIDARARDITSLMSHRCLRDRSDRRAIESCCAVLAGCFDATRPFRPQAERLAQYHYRSVSHASDVPSWLAGLLRELAEFVSRREDP